MIQLDHKESCCGCNVCGDVCPTGAITFCRDEGGFLYPEVDQKKCTNCGLCDKICPMHAVEKFKKLDFFQNPPVFAAIANDLQLLLNSASGGMFAVFAKKILDEGGYVGGAVWDDSFLVKHILTNNPDDLKLLQGSKYTQSDARSFFIQVEKLLKQNEKVLVSGLPCQMLALRSFLRKDYDNLLIVDLVCRNINAPFFVQHYIKMHERNHHSEVLSVRQKDKSLGWRNITVKMILENGERIYDHRYSSYFQQAFDENVVCRPSCFECKFKGFPRFADITIADCWGVADHLPPDMDNDMGTSLVLCNTQKGKDFFAQIADTNEITSCEVKLEDALKKNIHLLYPVVRPPVDVSNIYRDMNKYPLEQVLDAVSDRIKSYNRQQHFSAPNPLKKAVKKILRPLYKSFLLLNREKSALFAVNTWRRIVFTRSPLLIPSGRFMFEAKAGSRVIVNAETFIGKSAFKKSLHVNELYMAAGSRFEVNGGYIGEQCSLMLEKKSVLKIGRDCSIGKDFSVRCKESVKIGNDVFIGNHVSISDIYCDRVNLSGFEPTAPVEIGDHVWIGNSVTIAPGVKIGRGAVISSSSVVQENILPGTLYCGDSVKKDDMNFQKFYCDKRRDFFNEDSDSLKNEND